MGRSSYSKESKIGATCQACRDALSHSASSGNSESANWPGCKAAPQ